MTTLPKRYDDPVLDDSWSPVHVQKIHVNGHRVIPVPRSPRPALSPVEQVVVAMVLTALLARLWRWW